MDWIERLPVPGSRRYGGSSRDSADSAISEVGVAVVVVVGEGSVSVAKLLEREDGLRCRCAMMALHST